MRENTEVFNKKFIFFFDVNDTMFIGDTAKGVNKQIAILKLLAEQFSAIWDTSITREAITFKQLVEQYLCPGDKRTPLVQNARNEQYLRFIAFMEERKHPLLEEIKTHYDNIQANTQTGHIPLSFIRFLNYLQESEYNYTIIFRTFGNDIEAVENELIENTSLKLQHRAKFNQGSLCLNDGSILRTPHDLLNYVQPFEHGVWQDNFADWKATGESYLGGKPYPIDLNDDERVSIFFDDNVEKQIISVKPTTTNEMSQEGLQEQLMHSGRIVSVNTFSVCTDADYFIRSFELACRSSLKQENRRSPLQQYSTFGGQTRLVSASVTASTLDVGSP